MNNIHVTYALLGIIFTIGCIAFRLYHRIMSRLDDEDITPNTDIYVHYDSNEIWPYSLLEVME